MGYGFSLADNPFDICVLTTAQKNLSEKVNVGVSPLGETDQSKVQDSPKPRREPETSVHWVRLVDRAIDNGDERASYVFSPNFLHETAKKLCNERERIANNICLIDQTDFSDAVMTHNKLKVMCVVEMLLQKQHSNITQYNEDLLQWPDNEKQFHAARYRRSQLHILTSVSTSILDHVAGIVGMRATAPRDVRVVRLEHTVTESPKPLLMDYRAVLNAGLGTRNPEKIRARGFTEAAYTLWLCGLWRWRASVSICSDEKPAAARHNGFLQWLGFLDELYPEVPYKEGSAAPLQLIGKPLETTTDTERTLLVASLLDMVQAAVKKHPGSMYNSTTLTAHRLLWCLNIVQEESVMSPNLEGRSGESNDEQLLFMEYPMQAAQSAASKSVTTYESSCAKSE